MKPRIFYDAAAAELDPEGGGWTVDKCPTYFYRFSTLAEACRFLESIS